MVYLWRNFFRQNDYEKAIDDLEKSIKYKAKVNNLYILLGISYAYKCYYYDDHDHVP